LGYDVVVFGLKSGIFCEQEAAFTQSDRVNVGKKQPKRAYYNQLVTFFYSPIRWIKWVGLSF